MTGFSPRERVASSRGVYVIKELATAEQAEEVHKLVKSQTAVSVAVDVRRQAVAVGRGLDDDRAVALKEDGSLPEDIWGVVWLPKSKEVLFDKSPLNIRPNTENSSIMTIEDLDVRAAIEKIVRARLEI